MMLPAWLDWNTQKSWWWVIKFGVWINLSQWNVIANFTYKNIPYKGWLLSYDELIEYTYWWQSIEDLIFLSDADDKKKNFEFPEENRRYLIFKSEVLNQHFTKSTE